MAKKKGDRTTSFIGMPLGRILATMGVPKETILAALSKQAGLEPLSYPRENVKELVRANRDAIPLWYLERHEAVVVTESSGILVVLVALPLQSPVDTIIDELEGVAKKKVELVATDDQKFVRGMIAMLQDLKSRERQLEGVANE